MLDHLKNYQIVLGSQSPRRQQLLNGLGINFSVEVYTGDEDFPVELKREEIPVFLSIKKSKGIVDKLKGNYLLITSDTIVWINDRVLNKPADHAEAVNMLSELSGKMHEVYTGVTIASKESTKTFFEKTSVYFKPLSIGEIEYYIKTCKPFDKAGSYGVQEWLGYIAIEKIEGCFFNVMGLPLSRLYKELGRF